MVCLTRCIALEHFFSPLVAYLQKLGDFTIPRFLALPKVSEDLARWACRLAWLQPEPNSWFFLKVGTQPPLGHDPHPTHWGWPELVTCPPQSLNHCSLLIPPKEGTILPHEWLSQHDHTLSSSPKKGKF